MSRFDFMKNGSMKDLLNETLGQVTIGEGEPYEVTFDIPVPRGKKFGDLSLKLLEVVTHFKTILSPEDGKDPTNVDVEKALIQVWGSIRHNEEFWNTLLPGSLGLLGTPDEKDGLKYLETFPSEIELMNGFIQASQMIVQRSFGGREAEEATSKSQGEEGGEAAKEKAA